MAVNSAPPSGLCDSLEDAKRRPSHRSLTGCVTCRRRKVKCDDVRPACGVCRRLQLACEGFEVRIRWLQPFTGLGVNSNWVVDGTLGLESPARDGRRPLYSAAERKSMADHMARSMMHRNYRRTMTTMDAKCPKDGTTWTVGPFGVFQAEPSRASRPYNNPTPTPSTSPDETSPWGLFDSMPDIGLDLMDVYDENCLPVAGPDFASDLSTQAFSHLPHLEAIDPRPLSLDVSSRHLPPSMPAPDDFGLNIPANVDLLLNHFREQYVGTVSLIKNLKSPWLILHFPSALMTLGDLVIWKIPNHFRTSLFYTILALSSFHLDRLSGAEAGTGPCWAVGMSHYDRAKRELEKGLAEEPHMSTKVKYKDILMALLTMVTVCITNGEMSDARTYLLKAQDVIQSRGAAKLKKSRKVKTLHSIFLFLRVIEESTFLYPRDKLINLDGIIKSQSSTRYPSLELHAPKAMQSSQPCVWDDLGDSEPERDGHSIFSLIYGLPESLLALISHITCLSHTMQLYRSHPHLRDSSSFQDLEKRCDLMEDRLCNWNFSMSGGLNETTYIATRSEDNHTDGDINTNRSMNPSIVLSEDGKDDSSCLSDQGFLVENMARAVHAACLIFFYKQVRQTNSFILQPWVRQVKQHLVACESYKTENGILSSSLAWPAFVAATEATDEKDFGELITHLQDCGNRSGLRNFDQAAKVAMGMRAAQLQATANTAFHRVPRWIDLPEMRTSLICS